MTKKMATTALMVLVVVFGLILSQMVLMRHLDCLTLRTIPFCHFINIDRTTVLTSENYMWKQIKNPTWQLNCLFRLQVLIGIESRLAYLCEHQFRCTPDSIAYENGGKEVCRYVCVCWVFLNLEWWASESTVMMKLCECVGDLVTELVHGHYDSLTC